MRRPRLTAVPSTERASGDVSRVTYRPETGSKATSDTGGTVRSAAVERHEDLLEHLPTGSLSGGAASVVTLGG